MMTAYKEYGRALFLLCEESATTEGVKEDVSTVCRVFSEFPEYIKLLDTPRLQKQEKLSLIDEAFSSLDLNLKNLIKILSERHLVHSFTHIAREYNALYDESRGIERVEAITAIPMTDEQLAKLKDKLSSMTGKRIIIKNTINPEILGGVTLRYSGTQIDGSVKTRLDKFGKTLKNTVI